MSIIEQATNLMSGKKSEQIKKGTRSWTPSNLGDVRGKDNNYRYRWVRKDQDNIAKKLDEQWEMVSGLDGGKESYIHPSGRPDEGHGQTSVVERRDGVLMRMPNDVAEARDEFINGKTDRTTKALRNQAKKDLGAGVPVHGDISIERKGIRTVID